MMATTTDDNDSNKDNVVSDEMTSMMSSKEVFTSCELTEGVNGGGNSESSAQAIGSTADEDDSFECSLCSWGQTNKVCTSCEQKLEQAKDNDNADSDDTDSSCSTEDELDISACANCGKEGNSDDMNTCNKCKSVKYCNAACKKKHRSKHKKKCERLQKEEKEGRTKFAEYMTNSDNAMKALENMTEEEKANVNVEDLKKVSF